MKPVNNFSRIRCCGTVITEKLLQYVGSGLELGLHPKWCSAT